MNTEIPAFLTIIKKMHQISGTKEETIISDPLHDPGNLAPKSQNLMLTVKKLHG
jgi:hypothetical protein